ncbi:DUF4142 domain-containing protein [Azospirillum sp. ST 5-10]|uniref:DUF4142 domain-containing protein n=1 Tax=unclassified Azospirillum TaxID=2630922 RepID=UPI003F49EBD3
MRRALLLSVVLAASLPGAALAQPGGAGGGRPAAAAPHAQWSQQDRSFVRSAMAGSRFERQAAQLALTKAPDDAQLQRFARRMDEDHAAMANRLLAIVPPRGEAPPADMTATQRDALKRLQGLSGDAFAAAYIRGQVAAHEHDVAAFERQAEHGDVAMLKTFAEDSLPTLREHLEFARDLQQRLAVAEAPAGVPGKKPTPKPQ